MMTIREKMSKIHVIMRDLAVVKREYARDDNAYLRDEIDGSIINDPRYNELTERLHVLLSEDVEPF